MKLFGCLVAVLLMALPLLASGPPALCKPCLFYAGDIDPNSMFATLFYDEDTLQFPQTKTYAEFTVPNERVLNIDGILFQIMLQSPPIRRVPPGKFEQATFLLTVVLWLRREVGR